jgi:cell division protein FtsL
MILRVLNLVVIGALILAAAYVYRIKYDSTVQAERLAKIRSEVRRERDTIAALRAEWGELQSPSRIEALAKRYLHLKPIAPTQFDKLNGLPDQPPQLVRPDSRDPIGDVIENLEEPPPTMTGSIWPPAPAPSIAPAPPPADAAARAPASAAADSASGKHAGSPAAKSGRLDR